MGKKVIGLAVTVALLMVVLSGCFLLPKPDTTPPTVTIISPQNGANIVATNGMTADVTVEASVTANSPIVGVTITLTPQNSVQSFVESARGTYGETSGLFTYKFTNLKPGTYWVKVEAQSSAKIPGSTTSKFTIGVAPQNPTVGEISVTPNYNAKYFVTNSPITFSAKVENPNDTGTLNVTATVNGNVAKEVSSSNGVYTFTYTPMNSGNATIKVTAILTVGTKTYTGTNSKTIEIYEKPMVTITASPADYSVATQPISFNFTTQGSVTAYLDVNGSTHAPYTSGTAVNSYLKPDEWNTLTLTFEGLGETLKTISVHVLGTRASNPNDTPYVFLIDKQGHVVNTNDWITVNAGDKIDLYGYILKGKSSIQNYDVKETYYSNENLTTILYGPTAVASESNLNESVVPLRLVAYLFNDEATDTFIKFDIDVNNSAAAFLRYDVKPISGNSVSVDLAPAGDTYEGAPETLNVTVESKQPITSIVLGQPKKAGTPFDGYATTTAYSNSQNETSTMSFSHRYIAPVSDVLENGIAAYGTTSGIFPFEVAFYGPSGTYSIGVKVMAVAGQCASATTTYKVQADTSAPTIKIKNGTSNSVLINGQRVYYGPMTVTATITDDHAIYWAKFESKNASITSPTIVVLPNNANITNYGVMSTTTTATVEFNGTGPFTIWAVASDKHFDPTLHEYGNTANSVMAIKGVFDNNAPSAELVGGKYDIDATSEYYSFTIEATDGNGVGLADTAEVMFTPVNGGTPVTETAQLDPQTPGYYKVLVNTDKLENVRYSVAVKVMDKLYSLISNPTMKKEHETTIETGYITVHHTYPKVAIFNNGTQLGATPTEISNDIFKIRISDPQFPWDWIDPSNYKNYVQITIAGPNEIFNPKTTLLAKYHTPGASFGYLEVEVPEIYINSATTNTPATVTMQVDVYDSVQPDKALFGQATAKFVPAEPLFTEEPAVTLGGNTVEFSSSTPVVATSNPSEFYVTINLSGMAQKAGMEITFYANGVKVGSAPASNGTYALNIPIEAGINTIDLTAVYAPSATVTYAVSAQGAGNENYYSYSYKYQLGKFVVFGDTITPMATISVDGQNITNSSTIVTSATALYSLEGAAFYAHDYLSKYSTDLGMNTTVNGEVKLTTSSTQTILATPTLGATETLEAAGFNKAGEYVITKNLTTMASAGIYSVQFTANDPFKGYSETTKATIVVDLVPPTIDYATPDVSALGVVPSISNGQTISFSATDDAGVNCVKASLENLLYGNATSQSMSIGATGIGVFNTTATMTVSLPTFIGAQFQNLPYVLTIEAKDVAGHMAAPVTRLFVTNVDHNPYVAKIIAVAPNKALVRLTEPMWVNNFKFFAAYSETYGATITSMNIQPVTTLATYNGQGIANEFYVTFNYDIWTSAQIGSDVRTDLYNVRMSSSTATYSVIRDLAGNQFAMPINTTVPPVLTVTPASTIVGKGQGVTFTVSASSIAGIQKIVGNFEGQTHTIYAASGTITFVAPSPSTSTSYTAYFTAYDNSVNQNTTTATAEVYVNAVLPNATLTVPATAGTTFVATVSASVGDPAGGNAIKSVVVNGVAATYIGTEWVATVTYQTTVSEEITVEATVTDSYGNVTVKTKNVYVDVTPPTITVGISSPNVWFVSTSSHLWSYPTDTATVELYYKTLPTFYGTVTDNSNATITVVATYDNVSVTASGVTVVSSDSLTNGITQLSVAATDIVGNGDRALVTFIATADTEVSTAEINSVPTATVTAASPTAIATYTVTDAQSGIAEAMITVTSTSGSKASASITAGTLKTVDLMPLLKQLPIINEGATDVYVTITATDNVGNATTTAVSTINVNLTFSITNATITNNELVITFNAPVDETTVASDDILLYNTSTGTLTATTYTVNSTVITVDKVVDNQGTTWSVGLLPSGTYTLTVNNVKSLTTEIPLSSPSATVTK